MISTSHCDLSQAHSQPPFSLDDIDTEFPALLPPGVTRNDLLRLLEVGGNSLGISRTDRRLLRCYVCCTPPDHWNTRGCVPLCWKSTADIAAELGMSPETIRRHHRELVDKGLVRDRSRGDYWRGVEYRDGRRIVYGVDLSPLASSYIALVEAVERKRRQEANLGRLRERLGRGKTALRREIRRMERLGASHAVTAPARTALEDLPLRPSRLKDTTELATQLRDCEQALEALQRAAAQACEKAPSLGDAPNPAGDAEEPRNPHDTGPGHPKMPAADHGFDRPPITNYESRKRVIENYNSADTTQRPPGRTDPFGGPERKAVPARTSRQSRPVAGKAAGRERRRSAADSLHPEPGRLILAAGEDARCIVEISAGNGPAGVSDFIRAASIRRVGLGISDTLWNAAVTGLGPYPAAVAVTLGDRKRSDPVNPVRVPGAWLTGILRKHAAGETVDFVRPVEWLIAQGPEAPAVPVAAEPPAMAAGSTASPPPAHSRSFRAGGEAASCSGPGSERLVSPERLKLLAEEMATKTGYNLESGPGGRRGAVRRRLDG